MPRRRVRRFFKPLTQRIASLQNGTNEDLARLIRTGRVLVDGRPLTNLAALVPANARIVILKPTVLRGEPKLRAALAHFGTRVAGRVALDLGAAAGGFTRVLLEERARRVYAVDAGFGQLLGSLRSDPRVVTLERTNLADLDRRLVPDVVDIITIDVSYLRVADAVPQLESLAIEEDANLIALVKPTFELGLASPPPDEQLPEALARAIRGIEASGWDSFGSMKSAVKGASGTTEFFVFARRR